MLLKTGSANPAHSMMPKRSNLLSAEDSKGQPCQLTTVSRPRPSHIFITRRRPSLLTSLQLPIRWPHTWRDTNTPPRALQKQRPEPRDQSPGSTRSLRWTRLCKVPLEALTLAAEAHCFMGWQESLKSSSSCRKHRDTSCGRKGCQENKMWQPSRYKFARTQTYTLYILGARKEKLFPRLPLPWETWQHRLSPPSSLPTTTREASGDRSHQTAEAAGPWILCSGTTRLFAR